MTHARPPQPQPRPETSWVLSRRAALTGLAAGAGTLAVGAAAGCAAATPRAAAAAPDPSPGAMKLFDDPGYNFAGLLALGAAGMRASEVGEVLTAVNAINTAGLSAQTFTDTFRAWGDRLAAPPAAGRHGGETPSQTRRSARCGPRSTTPRPCSTSSAPAAPATRRRSTWPAARPGTPSPGSAPRPPSARRSRTRRPACRSGSSGPTTGTSPARR
ncbi:hypothetical protein [Streptomyces sp. NBC_01296]|uniref:hypothetical protein n=1 Tax=Streptomyces sp. NBC_01296 TaxID=2903816 RepID=UPI002E0E9A0B|nr:hypothetical protein OG299_05985 [Streptomyces sp. NBC_01296]